MLRAAFALISLCALAHPARAGRAVSAARLQGAVSVDGVLDDAAWALAPVSDGFWQRVPDEGRPPRFATEFRVLYDDSALYVAVRAQDPDPAQVRGLLTRRDELSASDWIGVSIDSYHDRRTAFTFAVNPAGVQIDVLLFDDNQEDWSWNAVFSSAAAVDHGGWTAEFRIPFSQLRFSPAPDQVWGLQVIRMVHRTKEESFWSPWPRDSQQRVSLYGALEGLVDLHPSRRLELLPYTLGGVALAPADAADPFHDDAEALAGLGLDLKYGLGPNLTLAGTINPDFGQVEADPSEVNLTANETFFAEKRPFFLEGTELFKFPIVDGSGGIEQLFYSRRIGAPPQAGAAGLAPYVDEPDATTIYGAAKLSGKLSSGWSIAVLDAVTAEERARLALDDGSREEVVVEPLTNFGMIRVRKDLDQGRTTVGAAATTVHRALDDTGLDWLRRQAYAGGLWVTHRFADDAWAADFKLLGSHVRGSEEAITATQLSSARYFQRPDSDHVELDPTRTSLSGLGATWFVGKVANGNWRGGGGGWTRTPGFEVNDLGYQPVADHLSGWLWLEHVEDEPGEHLREWRVELSGWSANNYEPRWLGSGISLNANAALPSYWVLGGGVNANFNQWNTMQLRGGPALRDDLGTNLLLNGGSDPRRTVRFNWNGSINWRPGPGSGQISVSPSLAVQAASNIDINVGVGYFRRDYYDQYVTTVADLGGVDRYVLARILQHNLSLTVRANLTLTPTLSMQLYAQPFIATGAYDRYLEVVDPTARQFDDRYEVLDDELMAEAGGFAVDRGGDGTIDYRFGRPDFNVRELSWNLVGRWEYRPGSTLFAIWSHRRGSFADQGVWQLGDDLSELASAPGEHVIMLKLTYWVGS